MYPKKPLPFYMTYPYLNIYEQENALDMEMQKMKSYYPENASVVQDYVEEACDHIEYEGSIMYDEYPDRFMMEQMCNHIYRRLRDEDNHMKQIELEKERLIDFQEEKSVEEVTDDMSMQQISDRALRELVQVMFYNEVYRRRCRRKRCRRYF